MKKISMVLLLSALFLNAQFIKVNEKQAQDLGIQTQKVNSKEGIKFAPVNGKVVLLPQDIITIASPLNAVIGDIYIKEFDTVQKAQKVLSLRSREFLKLQQEYLSAFLKFENKTQMYSRDQRLYDAGIISQKRLLVSKQETSQSQLLLDSLQKRLLESGLDTVLLKQIRETLTLVDEISIYAPRAGEVYEMNVNSGKSVEVGETLVRLYTQNQRYLEFEVPLAMAKYISLGDRALLQKYKATIVSISERVNEASQSLSVRAIIQEGVEIPIHKIYQVQIQTQKQHKLFEVKKSALVFRGKNTYVFKKVAQGFEALEVNLISEDQNFYTIQADLNTEDLLAINSTIALLSAMEEEDE